MSLQVCGCCGWSKVTTYQGLRTHQGKMGCTPKGMRIPESDQYRFSSSFLTPTFTRPSITVEKPKINLTPAITYESQQTNLFTESPKQVPVQPEIITTPEKSLQVCDYCGWSEVTTYQGLRTHQGKKGCTPKGVRIPESDQYRFSSSFLTPTFTGPSLIAGMPLTDTFSPAFRFGSQQTEQDNRFTPVQSEMFELSLTQTFDIQANPAATGTNRSLFQTPQSSPLTVSSARRALDFSSSAWPVEKPQETKEEELQKENEAQMLRKTMQDQMRADLQLKIHQREEKMAEVQSSAMACQSRLDDEWQEINMVFAEVVRVVQDTWKKALQPLEQRKLRLERDTQHLIEKLQREIDKLKLAVGEMDQNSDTPVCPVTSLDQTQDWHGTVDSAVRLGSLRGQTAAMMEAIHLELDQLSAVELKRFPTFAADIKLDPTTAHRWLVVSPGGKEVKDGGKDQLVPNTRERFDAFGSILGLNKLSSRKSYWEVEVASKTGWDLGVARCNANRKGNLSLKPDEGYWVMVHYEGEKYAALDAPPISLSLPAKPQRVAVFVDYEEGLVSFYDVMAQRHIHSFTGCQFRDEIHPYFSPHLQKGGRNSDPLIICA
ncbi:uncharacterized protein V6R79_000134 [Siganus canaliculatus]